MSIWPVVQLGKVIRQRKDFIVIDDFVEYRRCRVQLHAQGIVLRDTVFGSEIKTKRQQVCKAGDFLVAEIDAKVGGFGVVSDDLDGAIVSSHYFLFEIDEEKLDRKFLDCFVRTPVFQDQVTAQGSTNYAAIRPNNVLGYQIPLPPLAEQRRIVARIEELAAKINEARGLRRKADENLPSLLLNQAGRLFTQLNKHFNDRTFGSFYSHVSSGPRNWARHYEERGYRFYRAQDIGPEGQVLHDSKVYIDPPAGEQGRSAMLEPGDLMLVITGATVGRVAVFHEGFEPGFVNQHVAICRLPSHEIDPEFVIWGLRAPTGQAQLLGQRYGQGKPGLNLANIRQLHLPFPPLCEQRRIVEKLDRLQAQVNALKSFQRETAAELGALLPSILDKAFSGQL